MLTQLKCVHVGLLLVLLLLLFCLIGYFDVIQLIDWNDLCQLRYLLDALLLMMVRLDLRFLTVLMRCPYLACRINLNLLRTISGIRYNGVRNARDDRLLIMMMMMMRDRLALNVRDDIASRRPVLNVLLLRNGVDGHRLSIGGVTFSNATATCSVLHLLLLTRMLSPIDLLHSATVMAGNARGMDAVLDLIWLLIVIATLRICNLVMGCNTIVTLFANSVANIVMTVSKMADVLSGHVGVLS